MLRKHVRSTEQKVCSKADEQVVALKCWSQTSYWQNYWLHLLFFGVSEFALKCALMYVLVSARLPVAFVRPAQTRNTVYAQLQNSQAAKTFLFTRLLHACIERCRENGSMRYCAAAKNNKLNCCNFMNGVFICTYTLYSRVPLG